MLTRVRQRPAHNDHGRVQQADDVGEYLPDAPTGFAQHLNDLDRAGTSHLGDVPARVHVDTGLLQLGDHGGTAGDSLETAGVATPAQGVVGVADLDVSEVAGGALRAAAQRAVGDDAGTDPGRDLDEDEIVDVGPGDELLAEGHDVDVVVDDRDPAECGLEVSDDVEAVPAGHDRWVGRAPGRVLDRAG